MPTLKTLITEGMEEHTRQALERHGVYEPPKAEKHANRLASVLSEALSNGIDDKLSLKASSILKLYRKDYPSEDTV